MPYNPVYRWEQNEAQVLPSGIRGWPVIRRKPYPVGGVKLVLHLKTKAKTSKEIKYTWFIKRKHNGGDTDIGVSGDGKVNIRPSRFSVKQPLISKPLVFPAQYSLQMIFNDNQPEVMCAFDIPEVDKETRTNLEKIKYGAIGGAIFIETP